MNTTLLNFPEKMAIVDCETTGGKATKDRIIEIAIILVDNGIIQEKWQCFINPERSIPPWISKLTGIYSTQVQSAPTFSEAWPEIHKRLEGRTFVAHNARFDYGFVKNEAKRSGYSYAAKTLCTVKLSRQLYPRFKQHSLDAIIKRLGCHIENRHRALDDAEILILLLTQIQLEFDAETIDAACNRILKRPSLPSQLCESEVNKLPDTPGVYYFYNQNDRLLYIGKSVNLKTRVLSHFYSDHQHSVDHKLSHQLARIEYTETATDFGAQILEAQEVKRKSPSLNRRLKKTTQLYQYEVCVEQGYKVISIVSANSQTKPHSERFGLFRSRKQAQKVLEKLTDDHFLCHRLCGLEKGKTGSCFAYQLKKCMGACCDKEPAQSYNIRLDNAMHKLREQQWPYPFAILVEEHNPAKKQRAYHLVDNWCYLDKIECADEIWSWQPIIEQGNTQKKPMSSTLFDLDIYFILIRFLLTDTDSNKSGISVHLLDPENMPSIYDD